MIDPRLRQLYNPQLADRNRLEGWQARRVALGARRRYELELQRRPSLDDFGRRRGGRPRFAVAAVTVLAAVIALAVVLAAGGGVL